MAQVLKLPVQHDMAKPDTIEAIESLQHSQSNIKVYTAIPMGVLMILYFFSYATLIDKGMYGMLTFEIVTSILFILAIIYINWVSFVLLKMRYKNKLPYKDVLQYLSYLDLSGKPGEISRMIENRRQHPG